MKKTIRLTEGDLHRIVNESVNRVLNESTQFDGQLQEVIEFLEELGNRLGGRQPLLGVNGFEGGNRMFAVDSIRECTNWLKKMVGNLYPTDYKRPANYDIRF